MSRAIAFYRPSRRYAVFAAVALAATVASAWGSTNWGVAWLVASVLMGLTTILTLAVALRPAIGIHGTHISIGKRVVFWNEIQRLDRISVMNQKPWIAPLVLRLTLASEQAILIFHPGDADSCIGLLRHIYRYSRSALLDGVEYSEFWGEQPQVKTPLSLPKPRLLLPEDEEEVERLFQKLKVAGRLDGSDES